MRPTQHGRIAHTWRRSNLNLAEATQGERRADTLGIGRSNGQSKRGQSSDTLRPWCRRQQKLLVIGVQDAGKIRPLIGPQGIYDRSTAEVVLRQTTRAEGHPNLGPSAPRRVDMIDTWKGQKGRPEGESKGRHHRGAVQVTGNQGIFQ